MRDLSRIRAAAAAGLLLVATLLVSCGTREDNSLGVGFIEDRAGIKEVRYLAVTPDSATDFQLVAQDSVAGTGSGLTVGSQSGYEARTLIAYDLLALARTGTTVDSAAIHWVYDGFLGAPSQLEVAVHRIAEDWTESPFPASFPALDAAADTVTLVRVDGDTLSPGDTVVVEVAAPIVQAFADSTIANFGMALVPVDDTDLLLEYWSRNSALPPRLVIRGTTSGGADTTATFVPTKDLTFLDKTAAFVPLDGQPGRLTVGRGIATIALLHFPLPDFDPRTTVNRAVLTVHVDQAMSSLNDFTVRPQRVTDEEWSTDSTAVDAVVQSSWLQAVSASTDSLEFEIRGLAVDWVREGNFGLMLRAHEGRADTDYFRFHGPDTEAPALAPVLHVWYTPADPGAEP